MINQIQYSLVCKRCAFWNFETQSISLIFGALDSFLCALSHAPGPQLSFAQDRREKRDFRANYWVLWTPL